MSGSGARSVNCAAGEKARTRISTVAVRAAIPEPQEGRFPGSAGADHGDDVADVDLDADTVYEQLVRDRAGEILGFERDGLRGLLLFKSVRDFLKAISSTAARSSSSLRRSFFDDGRDLV